MAIQFKDGKLGEGMIRTPTPRESFTITLTPDEQDKILISVAATPFLAFYKKLLFLFPKSGDACLHSAQSPNAVGQGDSICPKCSSTSGVPLPTFQACSECFGLSAQSSDEERKGV